MEQLRDSEETSNPFSSFPVGLPCVRVSLSPHSGQWLLHWSPMPPHRALPHAWPSSLVSQRSRSYHDRKVCQSDRLSEHRHYDPRHTGIGCSGGVSVTCEPRWRLHVTSASFLALGALIVSWVGNKIGHSSSEISSICCTNPLPYNKKMVLFQLSSSLDLIKSWQKFQRFALPVRNNNRNNLLVCDVVS